MSSGRVARLNDPAVQQRVLDFIISFKAAHDGVSPSLREISAACDLRSTSTTYQILHRLINRQLIGFAGNRLDRNIMVMGGSWKAPKRKAAGG